MRAGRLLSRTLTEGGTLTMASSGEEGHPVDGDGHSAVLVVEVVDVVGGAEAGRHAGRTSLNGEGSQQDHPQTEPPPAAQTKAQARGRPGRSVPGHGGHRGGSSQQHHLHMGTGGPRGAFWCLPQVHPTMRGHLSIQRRLGAPSSRGRANAERGKLEDKSLTEM